MYDDEDLPFEDKVDLFLSEYGEFISSDRYPEVIEGYTLESHLETFKGFWAAFRDLWHVQGPFMKHREFLVQAAEEMSAVAQKEYNAAYAPYEDQYPEGDDSEAEKAQEAFEESLPREVKELEYRWLDLDYLAYYFGEIYLRED